MAAICSGPKVSKDVFLTQAENCIPWWHILNQQIEAWTKQPKFGRWPFSNAFFYENCCISNQISLNFVPKGSIYNKIKCDGLVMPGNKQLPDPILNKVHKVNWLHWNRINLLIEAKWRIYMLQ